MYDSWELKQFKLINNAFSMYCTYVKRLAHFLKKKALRKGQTHKMTVYKNEHDYRP